MENNIKFKESGFFKNKEVELEEHYKKYIKKINNTLVIKQETNSIANLDFIIDNVLCIADYLKKDNWKIKGNLAIKELRQDSIIAYIFMEKE